MGFTDTLKCPRGSLELHRSADPDLRGTGVGYPYSHFIIVLGPAAMAQWLSVIAVLTLRTDASPVISCGGCFSSGKEQLKHPWVTIGGCYVPQIILIISGLTRAAHRIPNVIWVRSTKPKSEFEIFQTGRKPPYFVEPAVSPMTSG